MVQDALSLRKIDRLWNQVDADAVLITNPWNMRYMSGFTGGEGFLLITRKERLLVTDSRYTIWAKNESQGYEVLEMSVRPNEMVAQLVEKYHIRRLAFETKQMTVYEFTGYEQSIPCVEWIPLQDEVTWLRSIKSEEEILCLQHAESIGDAAFRDVLGFLKPGLTEVEVANYLEKSMKEHGAEGLSFETIAASGPHSAMPHATPDQRKLQMGDFLTMDFGCCYHGYCSDMTRTVVIGQANEKQKRLYNTVLHAQLLVLEKIHAGMRGRDIDAIARDYIDSTEFKGCFGHGLGHSVGLQIHEMPALSRREDRFIQAGMIETVEPGIYVEDFGGVRIEDMVVVEECGCHNLTHSDKNLIEIM